MKTNMTERMKLSRRGFNGLTLGAAASLLWGATPGASNASLIQRNRAALSAIPGGHKVVEHSLRTDRSFTKAAIIVERTEDEHRQAVLGSDKGPSFRILNELYLSPDGSRLAYKSQRSDGKSILTLDGKQHEGVGSIVSGTLAFSPDGTKFVYVRSNPRFSGPSQAFAYLSDRLLGEYTMVFKPAFSPNSQRLVFAAAHQRRAIIVENGVIVDSHPALPGGLLGPLPPTFSADSKHLGYIAASRSGAYAVIDGQEESAFGRVSGLTFGNKSGRYGYIGINRGSTTVVVDGQRVGSHRLAHSQIEFSPDDKSFAYSAIDSNGGGSIVVDGKSVARDSFAQGPTFSPDGQRLAFWGGDRSSKYVVVDKEKMPQVAELCSGIKFSPDSNHVGYFAKEGERRSVYLDDKKLGVWDEVELSSLTFSPDSKHLAWVAKQDDAWRVVVNGEPVSKPLAAVARFEEPTTELLAERSYIQFDSSGRMAVVGVDAKSEEVARFTFSS